MFLHLSVVLFIGEKVYTPPGQTPPRQTPPPLGQTPLLLKTATTSDWNTFLLTIFFLKKSYEIEKRWFTRGFDWDAPLLADPGL